MARHKIDYGIDLGTTNSAIARIENGKIRVKKSDDNQMDTTPSCVSFDKKKTIFVGMKAYNQLSHERAKAFKDFSGSGKISDINVFAEFKRSMGRDEKYNSSNMDKGYSPEELSAEVLKKLKSYVRDEDVSAAIITIPMRFEQHQVDATRRAGELAGFQYTETLMEPIAASIAYGLESKKTQGYWLVFDLGGGTFDVALMRVVDGIMKVEDTDGDTRLGGRDIDYAIVDNILIPYLAKKNKIDKILSANQQKQLLRDALKFAAEESKIRLSKESYCNVVSDDPIGTDDNGAEMELDLKITIEDFKKAVEPIYRRAIDISKSLIQKHNLKGADLKPVILVGGTTYCQTLQKMLKEQLSPNIDTSMDPMTCVTQGAVSYASTRDIPVAIQKPDPTKIQLKLRYPATTVETEEKLGIRVERSQTTGEVPKKIFVEIARNDKAWSSGKIEIVDDVEIISIFLNTGEVNSFTITLYDDKGNIYPCEPSDININHGLVPAKQIIPYDICIDVNIRGKQQLKRLDGLEKNQTLPAKGKGSFITLKDIRPGIAKDVIRIPMYGGIPGTRAILNTWFGTGELTGEDFDKFLPKESKVEITLYMDSSNIIRLSAYFPDIDETIDVTRDGKWREGKSDSGKIEKELANADYKLSAIEENFDFSEKDTIEKLQKEVAALKKMFENGRGNDDDERRVEGRLKDVLKTMDNLETETEIPKAKERLIAAMKELTVVDKRYGNNKTAKIVEELQKKTDLAMSEIREITLINDLNDNIRGFIFAIKWEDIGFLVSCIKFYNDNYSSIKWTNSAKAKKLINEGNNIVATNPSKKELQRVIREIRELLPEGAPEDIEQVDITILGGY